MKWIGFLLVLLILWLPMSAVCGETITHSGATDPSTEGWRVMSGIPGGPDYEGEANWRIVTTGYGRWTPEPTLTDDWFVGEWSLTVRAKWNAGAMATQRCTIFDGYRGKSTAFTWDEQGWYYYVKDQGDTLMPNTAPDGNFHTATLVMDTAWDNSMVFLFDGEIVDVLSPDQQNDVNPGTFLLYWGDNEGSSGVTDVQYSYICFTNEPVPEPSTCLLLLTGLAAVIVGWRRFR